MQMGECPLPVVQAVIKREVVHKGPEAGHKQSILIYICVCVYILRECTPGPIFFAWWLRRAWR